MKVFRKAGNELELLYRQYWQQASLNRYSSEDKEAYFPTSWVQNSLNIPDSLQPDTKPTESPPEKDVNTSPDEQNNN